MLARDVRSVLTSISASSPPSLLAVIMLGIARSRGIDFAAFSAGGDHAWHREVSCHRFRRHLCWRRTFIHRPCVFKTFLNLAVLKRSDTPKCEWVTWIGYWLGDGIPSPRSQEARGIGGGSGRHRIQIRHPRRHQNRGPLYAAHSDGRQFAVPCGGAVSSHNGRM